MRKRIDRICERKYEMRDTGSNKKDIFGREWCDAWLRERE